LPVPDLFEAPVLYIAPTPPGPRLKLPVVNPILPFSPAVLGINEPFRGLRPGS